MAPRSIALTAEQDRLVETLVRSGRYRDADAVVGEGLRLVADQEAEDEEKLDELRAAAQAGLDAIERGEYEDFDSVEDLVLYLDKLGEDVISGKLDP